MERPLTPNFNLFPRPIVCESSFGDINKRTYPLNLKEFQEKSTQQKKKINDAETVPEFVKEYVKDAVFIKNKRKNTNKLHTRSKSVQPSVPSKQKVEGQQQISKVPSISYQDFKFSHRNSQKEEKIYIPQVIQISKRSKIILYSSNPITINPELYRIQKKSHHKKSTSSSVYSVFSNQHSSPVPVLTYGDKLLKLKSLMAGTYFPNNV